LNLGDDGDFLVASNNVIVGKIHGRNIELCKGDKSEATSYFGFFRPHPLGIFSWLWFLMSSTLGVPWCSDDIQVGCAVVAASGASLPGPQT
jgi:hypothetical protein